MSLILKAVDAGASATIVERAGARQSMSLRYGGPAGTFIVDEVRIANESCLVPPGPVPAEALSIHWTKPVQAGTEIVLRVRNISASPATFVATMDDDGLTPLSLEAK